MVEFPKCFRSTPFFVLMLNPSGRPFLRGADRQPQLVPSLKGLWGARRANPLPAENMKHAGFHENLASQKGIIMNNPILDDFQFHPSIGKVLLNRSNTKTHCVMDFPVNHVGVRHGFQYVSIQTESNLGWYGGTVLTHIYKHHSPIWTLGDFGVVHNHFRWSCIEPAYNSTKCMFWEGLGRWLSSSEWPSFAKQLTYDSCFSSHHLHAGPWKKISIS